MNISVGRTDETHLCIEEKYDKSDTMILFFLYFCST
jgi:hypothetical protein